MKFYDVYNGDADGLCALLQLRLAAPREAILVSGVKRDIRLLERVNARQGDDIVVMDIKMPGEFGGLEATQKIRKLNQEVPIIAQTA